MDQVFEFFGIAFQIVELLAGFPVEVVDELELVQHDGGVERQTLVSRKSLTTMRPLSSILTPALSKPSWSVWGFLPVEIRM